MRGQPAALPRSSASPVPLLLWGGLDFSPAQPSQKSDKPNHPCRGHGPRALPAEPFTPENASGILNSALANLPPHHPILVGNLPASPPSEVLDPSSTYQKNLRRSLPFPGLDFLSGIEGVGQGTSDLSFPIKTPNLLYATELATLPSMCGFWVRSHTSMMS